MLLIIIWYFLHTYFWPRPPQSPGLGLEVLASFNIIAQLHSTSISHINYSKKLRYYTIT